MDKGRKAHSVPPRVPPCSYIGAVVSRLYHALPTYFPVNNTTAIRSSTKSCGPVMPLAGVSILFWRSTVKTGRITRDFEVCCSCQPMARRAERSSRLSDQTAKTSALRSDVETSQELFYLLPVTETIVLLEEALVVRDAVLAVVETGNELIHSLGHDRFRFMLSVHRRWLKCTGLLAVPYTLQSSSRHTASSSAFPSRVRDDDRIPHGRFPSTPDELRSDGIDISDKSIVRRILTPHEKSHDISKQDGQDQDHNAVTPMSSVKAGETRAEDDVNLNAKGLVFKNIPGDVKKQHLVKIMKDLSLPLPAMISYQVLDSGICNAFANYTTADKSAMVIQAMNGRILQDHQLRVEYMRSLSQTQVDRFKKNHNHPEDSMVTTDAPETSHDHLGLSRMVTGSLQELKTELGLEGKNINSDKDIQSYTVQQWANLSSSMMRMEGTKGIVRILNIFDKHKVLIPTEGNHADRLWTTLVRGVLHHPSPWALDHLYTYARTLFVCDGRVWKPLYEHIIGHFLKSNSSRESRTWHQKLAKLDLPDERSLQHLVAVAISSRARLEILKMLHYEGRHNNLYDVLIPTLCQREDFTAAAYWDRYLKDQGDRPSEPAFDLSMQNSATQPSYMKRAPNTEDAKFVDKRRRSKGGLSDTFVARAFATKAFSLDAVSSGLVSVGLSSLGPLAMREVAVRCSSTSEILQRIEKLRNTKNVFLQNCVYNRLVHKLAVDGSKELLESVLSSDLHADAYEDIELQKKLLIHYIKTKDWTQAHRTLTLLDSFSGEQVTRFWNLMLRAHLRDRDWDAIEDIYEKMLERGIPITARTIRVSFFAIEQRKYLNLAERRERHHYIKGLGDSYRDDVKLVTNMWLRIHRTGGHISAQHWNQLHRYYGQDYRHTELESLSVWLATNHSQKSSFGRGRRAWPRRWRLHASRQASTNSDKESPVALIFTPSRQASIVEWGFKSLSAAPEKRSALGFEPSIDRRQQVDTPASWDRGLLLLKELQRLGVSVDMHAIRQACLNRLRLLFSGKHSLSARAENHYAVRHNKESLASMLQKINEIWGLWPEAKTEMGLKTVADTLHQMFQKNGNRWSQRRRISPSSSEPRRLPEHDRSISVRPCGVAAASHLAPALPPPVGWIPKARIAGYEVTINTANSKQMIEPGMMLPRSLEPRWIVGAALYSWAGPTTPNAASMVFFAPLVIFHHGARSQRLRQRWEVGLLHPWSSGLRRTQDRSKCKNTREVLQDAGLTVTTTGSEQQKDSCSLHWRRCQRHLDGIFDSEAYLQRGTGDIPSHAYTFNFALNPDWPRFFSYSPDIHAYLAKVVRVFGLEKYMTYSSEVTGCYWQEDTAQWQVNINRNGKEIVESCDMLLHATGILNNFKWPKLPGMDKFKGRLVHTARWPEDYQKDQWKNDRVAVIGSGASSIQTVPNMQPHTKHLDVFVRTGVWFVQIANNYGANKEYTETERDEFRRNPSALVAHSKDIEDQVNGLWGLFYSDTPEQAGAKEMFTQRMGEFIKDKRLLEGFTPKFGIGCRRVTPGDPYMEAIQEKNVDVHFTAVESITEKGVVGADGVEREADTIVCATGFDVSYKPRFPIVGRNGVDLRKKWEVIPESYLGLACPDMPNFITFVGPTWPVENGSVMGPLQGVGEYAIQLIKKMQNEGVKSWCPRQDVTDSFNEHVQEWIKHTVWKEGCRSWYRNNETGRVNAVWPGSSLHYLHTIRTPRYEDFEIEHANKANQWGWLGMGYTVESRHETLDKSPYINERNIDVKWLESNGIEKGQTRITDQLTQVCRKIPWRISNPQKRRQRKRLRLVDNVVATVSAALRRSGIADTKNLIRWKTEMPREEEMLAKNKYTMFDRKEKKYRKGVHSKFSLTGRRKTRQSNDGGVIGPRIWANMDRQSCPSGPESAKGSTLLDTEMAVAVKRSWNMHLGWRYSIADCATASTECTGFKKKKDNVKKLLIFEPVDL
ncbi:hypothetical protein FH972_026522 [Carpinus fangiana]|uniref:Flavin-containing monooxygenase n=1 Tax=Carpinus fangiana TaxID=176857 RepID=A0A5N6L4P8_9ROSI|nr:hypothetical protein FH972_026522 [Carpinus fangiana]